MTSHQKVDLAKLALLLGNYREQHAITLRDATKATGISASTLSRIERQDVVPDTDTLVKLSKWMGVDVSEVLGSPASTGQKSSNGKTNKLDSSVSTITNIELQLRADPNLDSKGVEALKTILAKAYELYVTPKGSAKRG